MKPFEKFLNETLSLKKLLEIYLQLRQHLQEEGFNEEDLEQVTSPTLKMMSLSGDFHRIKDDLFRQVNDYGFNVNKNEFNRYILPLLSKIDELTPLKNGNNKRRNQGDEDFE
jgi:hypothetical protein